MQRRKPIQLFTEVADDPMSLQTGLMHRHRLPWKSAMLFVFPSDGHHSFWMQNTYVPLDIAFITQDFKIAEIHSMVPMSTRSVYPQVPCKYALEVNAGWFEKNKVAVGDRIGGSIYHEAQNAVAPAVALVQSFRDAVNFANNNKLEMRIKYLYNDTGKVMDYVFVPSAPYQFSKSRDGKEYVVAPCKHASGEYRQFDIDSILEFNLFVPPQEGQNQQEFAPEDAGKEVAVPPVQPFGQNRSPGQVDIVNFPDGRAAARTIKKVEKRAQESSGGSDSAMMTDYWKEISDKKKNGMTEGEAILEYLEEKGGRSKKSKKSQK